jgi:hypothetical protein
VVSITEWLNALHFPDWDLKGVSCLTPEFAMSLEPMFLLTVLVVSIIAGFGWKIGGFIADVIQRKLG